MATASSPKDEWSASPALVAVSASYDKNGDGTLSAEEIAAGLAAWQQSGVGARAVPFVVRWNGRPLAGATVRLVPAPFLDDAVKGASGETGPGGAGQLSMAAEDRPRNAPNIPLMQPGLYHVEITHPSIKIPAKYNTQTTLGIEITSGNPGPEGVSLVAQREVMRSLAPSSDPVWSAASRRPRARSRSLASWSSRVDSLQ